MAEVGFSDEEEIRRVLQEACFNRELLILVVTLGERFESHFIHLDAGALHVAPTMSGEAVLYDLRFRDLGLRFPSEGRFLEGKTRLLGHGMVDGRRTLRMAIPERLQDDELRRGHRVTRTGKVEVSFHSKRYNLLAGQLMDISTGGLKVYAPGVDLEEELSPGDSIALTVPLEERLRIDTQGVVRWVNGRNMGLEFYPPLERGTLAALSRWVFQRREEERDQPPAAGAHKPSPGGAEGTREILLVSAVPELEDSLRPALDGLGPLVRIPGTLQGLKEAVTRNPSVILFHVKGSGLDDRRRLKALAELVGTRWPCVLVATEMEPAQLFKLSNDLKISHSFSFRDSLAPFFNRLVRELVHPNETSDATSEGAP
jgi:hypothetical protein